MVCPACNGDMIVVEYNRIEIDYCPQCRGVWFDAGELELLVQSADPDNLDQSMSNVFELPETECAEQKRKCPICNRKMCKTTLGQQPQIIVDVCREYEHGIFFDGGELGHIFKQITGQTTGTGQPVVDFLGEVFQANE